jgi:hypothetical protein
VTAPPALGKAAGEGSQNPSLTASGDGYSAFALPTFGVRCKEES